MSAQDAESFVAMLAELLKDNPGQPIALIEEAGEVSLGVMSIIPTEDDWFKNPVPVARLIDLETAA